MNSYYSVRNITSGIHLPGISKDIIDIVCDQTGELKKDEDPGIYHSEKTDRGPLSEDWLQQIKKNQGKPGHKVMCSYKLCKVSL